MAEVEDVEPEALSVEDATALGRIFPEIVGLLSVTHRSSDDYYFVDMTVQGPLEGDEPEDLVYVLGPTDPHGIAPEVRAAVALWIVDGKPVGEYVEPPPLPAPPQIVSLSDFWTRITDDEAEQFDDAMMANPIRLRRLYMAEQTAYTEGTELFEVVSATLVQLFGQVRRDQLFA